MLCKIGTVFIIKNLYVNVKFRNNATISTSNYVTFFHKELYSQEINEILKTVLTLIDHFGENFSKQRCKTDALAILPPV